MPVLKLVQSVYSRIERVVFDVCLLLMFLVQSVYSRIERRFGTGYPPLIALIKVDPDIVEVEKIRAAYEELLAEKQLAEKLTAGTGRMQEIATSCHT